MRRFSLASLAVVVMLAIPSGASASTFSNPAAITIPAGAPTVTEGPASPYPSTIAVTGVPGNVVKARATLNGYSHAQPGDVEVLLVAPGGARTILMSSVCGGSAPNPLTFTFEDAASASLPDAGPCLSGTYKPSKDASNPSFPPPAPSGPQTTVAMSALNGAPAIGSWQLFVFDRVAGDTGSIAGGWSLDLLTDATCSGRQATLTGTTGDEELVGTEGDDVILGFGGRDTINGLGGNDVICGGSAKDTLKGGKAKDRLLGQKGADTLKGGGGNDTCKGGKGDDVEKSC